MTSGCERGNHFPAPRRWEIHSEEPGDPRRVVRPFMTKPMAPRVPLFDGEPGDHWQADDAGL